MEVAKKLFGFGFLIGAVLGLFFVAGKALDTPVVYEDARSRDCVAVEDPKGIRPCGEQRPSRFEVVYVAPGITYSDLLYRK